MALLSSGSSVEFVGHRALTAPAISAKLLRIAADSLAAAITSLSSEEVRLSSASVSLVLVALVDGIVVADHDVPEATAFRVPRLAIGIDNAISVDNADVQTATVIFIWCLGGANAVYGADSPPISAEPSLISPSVSD